MGDGRWEMESERWVEYRKGKVMVLIALIALIEYRV